MFGAKVVCFQCDKKVKLKASKLRRRFRFCSDTCVEAFLAANVLRTPPDPPELLRTQLAGLLTAAAGALGEVDGRQHIGGSATTVALDMQRKEMAAAALNRFYDLCLQALPYLRTLGMNELFELLDTVDVDRLIEQAESGRNKGHAEMLAVHDRIDAAIGTL